MIDFKLSEDQTHIISSLVAMLSRTAIRADPPPWPTDSKTSSDVANLGALGWIGIAAPESCGGSAASLVEEALIAREYGRWLIAPDVLATALAVTLALHAGDPVLAQGFVEGRRAAAFGIVKTGKCTVVQAAQVSHYVVLHKEGMCLAFSSDDTALAPCVDPSLSVTEVSPVDLEYLCGEPVMSRALPARALILICAMLAGIAEASRDLAVDYARTRVQFGRTIGSFQAIKHHCADMHVRARLAYAQTVHSAMLIASELPAGTVQASAAFEVAKTAGIKNSEVGIQIHGAMGFSAECVAHRFPKRAHALRILGEVMVAMQPVRSGLAAAFQDISMRTDA